VVAQLSDAYEIHDVDLLDRRFSDPASDRESFFRVSLRFPNRWTGPVIAAARTPLVETFLGFSRFPAARSVVESDEFATVRLTDMRFVGGTVTLDQPTAPTNLFTAMVRIAPDGEILLQRLGR
jgi:hypothetical protein